jgi:hypothetical protein
VPQATLVPQVRAVPKTSLYLLLVESYLTKGEAAVPGYRSVLFRAAAMSRYPAATVKISYWLL